MIESPMNYTGSKYKLLEQLLPKFHKSNAFVDLFCGGGSVYLNVLDKYNEIYVNDIISDLIGIHQGILNDDSIINKTKELCPGKKNPSGYNDLRNSYNEDPTSEKLWALMLSCTNNMMRFNQKFKFNQTYGDRGWNPNTENKVNKMVEWARPLKDKIKFTSTHFKNVGIMEDTFYYCDPPYSNTEAGYNAYWKKDDDNNLYEYLLSVDKIGSKFMLSGVLTHDGVECELLSNLIKDGFNCQELEFNYNKVSRKKGNKDTKEVIITNY
jgi:DNA adenine methylase Dam